MKIAITGANGFIGSYLAFKLKKQRNVKIYLFNKKKHSLSDTQSLKSFVKNKDIIIHLAGVKNISDPSRMYEVNLLGTANLLEAVSLYGKKNLHFLFPSSFLVYKENYKRKFLNEKESPVLPKSHYGISKLLAEKMVEFYSVNSQIKTTILRIANVYGPVLNGKSNSVPNLFLERINNDLPLTIRGSGATVRDLIYIEDVVNAFLMAIKNQRKKFLLINICTGKETRMDDLIKLIEKELKKKAIIKYDKKYSEKIYWIGEKLKALKEINFQAKITIKTGIEKTITWYKKHHFSKTHS